MGRVMGWCYVIFRDDKLRFILGSKDPRVRVWWTSGLWSNSDRVTDMHSLRHIIQGFQIISNGILTIFDWSPEVHEF
ncbi:hypothetical protein TNCV_2376661 [Trichonephila clavipes]|nr:hypothetical protein TNCV_2376661 [Trichonephila clavipes]